MLSHAQDIQPIWTSSCSGIGCHDSGQVPNLSDGQAYAALVEAVSPVVGVAYVDPGNVAGSLLVTKLDCASAPMNACLTGCCGTMPSGSSSITDAQFETIVAWIEQGAQP